MACVFSLMALVSWVWSLFASLSGDSSLERAHIQPVAGDVSAGSGEQRSQVFLNPYGALNIEGESGQVRLVGHSGMRLFGTSPWALSQIAHPPGAQVADTDL
jgi:hypothetical protein